MQILEFISDIPMMIAWTVKVLWPVFVLLSLAMLVEGYRLPLSYSNLPEIDKMEYRDDDDEMSRKLLAFGRRFLRHVSVIITVTVIYILGVMITQTFVDRGQLSQLEADLIYLCMMVLICVLNLLAFTVIVVKTAKFRNEARLSRAASQPETVVPFMTGKNNGPRRGRTSSTIGLVPAMAGSLQLLSFDKDELDQDQPDVE